MYNISICSTIKNRCIIDTSFGTRYLFKNFLSSIKQCYNKSDTILELIITDFESTDIDNIDLYIKKILGSDVSTKIIVLKEKFNRGRGCNTAIQYATNETILVLDVDMKFDKDLINNVIHHTYKNSMAYFPICYTFEKDPFETNGFWLDVGYGNCSFLKKDWLDCGMIPEYNTWGHEDLHFFNKLRCNKIREKCNNFIHQWHPNEIEWKNRFSI